MDTDRKFLKIPGFRDVQGLVQAEVVRSWEELLLGQN